MKKILSCLLLAIMILALGSCNEVQTGANPVPERVLRIDGENLGYPSVYTSSPKGRGYMMVSYIFDTLVWKDEDGLVPMVASSWKVSEDNVTYTFELDKNAKFTDGESLDASDVKFSFDYIKEHPYQWVSVDMVKDVRVVDDYTVEIELRDIYVPFISDVAGNVPIMPEHIWEGVSEPEKFNAPEAVIGSGPLMLESYDETSGSYVFTANKDYFLGKPQIDRLIISPVENTIMALAADEIDMAVNVKYGEAKKNYGDNSSPKFQYMEGPGLWVGRVYMNFANEALKVKELRQALYYSINRQDVVDKPLKGAADVGNAGYIHPSSFWYNDKVKDYEFSVEKANSLLDSVLMLDSDNDGIREFEGSPLSFEFIVSKDQVDLAELLKASFGEIGVEIQVKALDLNTVASLIEEGKFELAFNGHGSFGGDPVLLKTFVSDKDGQGFAPKVTTQGGEGWFSEEFNEVFARQIVELDEKLRYDEVARLQEIMAEELPTLTLYYKKTASVYNKQVFDGWFYTKDGVSLAVPTVHNKLVFVRGKWTKQ